MNEYIKLVEETPLKLFMGIFFLSHNETSYDSLLSLGVSYENLPMKRKDRLSNYGCLLGIYAYHLQAAKLNAYMNLQTLDEQDAIFEEVELLFMDEYDVEFSYSPFRLNKWPQVLREKFLKAKTDIARKKIALAALEGAIV